MKTKNTGHMRHLFLSIIILLTALSNAQDSLSYNKKYIGKNNIGIELGGTGLFYSAFYERPFCIKNSTYQSFKIGGNYLFNEYDPSIFLPMEYNFYFGRKGWKLLGGAGIICEFGPYASPASFKDRQQFRHIYKTSGQDSADQWLRSKGYSDYYVPRFDLGYSAKIGVQYLSKKRINFHAYLNLFYIRDHYTWYFQPWLGIGLSYKINRLSHL